VKRQDRPQPSTSTNQFTLLLLLSLFAALAFIFFFKSKTTPLSPDSTSPLSTASISPSPTPTIVPIPTGKFTYKVMTGIKTGPLFQDITLDPYDPSPNSPQIISVQINSQKPVAKAQATLTTDHNSYTQPLVLIKGSSTNGTYQTTFTYSDSYDYLYKIKFEAQDDSGQSNQNEVILR
jgi:hypothetical protein